MLFNLDKKYKPAINLGPDFCGFERFNPDTAWGMIYEWILKFGPYELKLRKRVLWRHANRI